MKFNVKKLTVIYLALAVSIGTLLVFLRLNTFKTGTVRLLEILDITNLKAFFQINPASEEILDETIMNINDSIKNIPKSAFSLSKIVNGILNGLLFLVNVGLNLILLMLIYLNESFNATSLKIRKTIPAKVYLFIVKSISIIIKFFKSKLKLLLKFYQKHKRFIILNTLFYLLALGILYLVIIEIVIFTIVYIYKAFLHQTHLFLSEFLKYLFLKLFPFLKMVPTWLWLLLFLYILFRIAVRKAEKRLKHNHLSLKKFVSKTLTQTTFINGPPGVGKTLVNVCCSLASEEAYIDELEENLFKHQTKYPYLNFAEIRKKPEKFPEHHEYSRFYSMLNDRSSLLISNYAIFSPYYKDFSKIFDFNFMRKNKKSSVYALEEYTVISLSELDKEYNSHDDMKRVGEEGAATFFSTVSHDLKRHVKIFCDYQLKDQVPLRIRGNSEYFYTLISREKKYPKMLYLFYSPFISLTKLVKKLITKYETKRPYINKKTKRKTVSKYKRNDVSLIYAILRQLAFALNKIADYFDHYWFFEITGDLSMHDGAIGNENVMHLNVCDLSIENMALYDSTFLSYAYEEKRNKAFKDLEKFTRLIPTTQELTKCHSHFYDRLNGIDLDDEPTSTSTKKSNSNEEEFIEIPN